MRTAEPASALQTLPWRRGPSAVISSLWRRSHDPRFWLIQGMVLVITGLHYGVESIPVDESLTTVHHIPVILYLLPVVYASLHYGWEGGVLTAVWSGLLTAPSIVTSHSGDFHWTGEVGQVGVTLLVGTVLAWRVKLEAEERRRAERTSAELAVSEERYRSIFENAGDPILLCGGDGRILAANEAVAAMSGYTLEELQGLPADRLFGRAGAERLLNRISDARSERLSMVLTKKDGSTAAIEAVRAAPAGGDEEPAVQTILRDVTEQERRHADMRSYVREVTRAQEEERRRIARELHDETAQSLVLLCRGLDASGSNGNPGEIRQLAESILEGVRRFSRDLRPSVLDDLGLLPAIEWVAAEVSRRGVVSASVEVQGTPRRLPSEAELALFRIVQEALRNAEKHAGPCTAEVRIAFKAGEVTLAIVDTGRGFQHSKEGQATPPGRLGILGMQERAGLIGADLRIEAEAGEGTRLEVRLPTDAE